MTGRRLEDLPDCLSVEEAGVFLGLSRNGTYAAVTRGELRVIKIGRRLIVPKAALEQLLAAGPEARP